PHVIRKACSRGPNESGKAAQGTRSTGARSEAALHLPRVTHQVCQHPMVGSRVSPKSFEHLPLPDLRPEAKGCSEFKLALVFARHSFSPFSGEPAVNRDIPQQAIPFAGDTALARKRSCYRKLWRIVESRIHHVLKMHQFVAKKSGQLTFS